MRTAIAPWPADCPWPHPAVTTLIKEWTRALRAENKSPSTIRGWCDIARNFHLWCERPTPPSEETDPAAWLTDLPPAPATPGDVTASHIRGWIAVRLAATSAGNANNNYRGLQAWFAWLLEEQEVDTHPMARLKPPKAPVLPPPIISDDLLVRVLDTARGRDFVSVRDTALIRLIFDSGARLAEVAGIGQADLDMDMAVFRTLVKGDKPHAVPFGPKTARALGRYLRVRARHPQEHLDALWLGDRQRGPLSPNGVKLMLRRRGREAGVNEVLGRNLHAHLGRHYSSHHFLDGGGSEGDLMRLRGWSSPEMARRYGASAAGERAIRSARRLDVGSRF